MRIKKILIANRGEIAIRIIRTCKEMGIKTVALCPRKGEEDNFLETKLADEFYYLNEEGILGYLDQRRLIQIAKKARVQALHPGYGFLAENGDFAQLCERNNIKFVGPRPETLRILGDKLKAREIAQKLKCPLLPGTKRPIRDEKDCKKLAKEIGLPLLLKASWGGGGVGIEVINEKNKDQLLEIFQRLKREVKNAFGKEEIFMEKFLQNPRHIEFQILGDGKGNVVHFGERECSIQRRNQKLIEEAPSPFLDKGLRKKMGKMAVKLGEYLKYEGVGTVEFLVDKKRNFYFMEVNPRLQVEHPVTELVYGIDLVKKQIEIAAGEELNLKQKEIKPSGWAMEFRINAEDPYYNFRPTTGTISQFLPPGGRGVEIHTFCHQGQVIFPYFDSLLAKLVVFGKNREAVIKRARRALDEFVIEGVPTLIPLYKIILENQKFIKGQISTSFIEKERIIEALKKKYPKKKQKTSEEKTKIEKKDIALLCAQLYQQFKRQTKHSSKINKWKLVERINVGWNSFRNSSWKHLI